MYRLIDKNLPSRSATIICSVALLFVGFGCATKVQNSTPVSDGNIPSGAKTDTPSPYALHLLSEEQRTAFANAPLASDPEVKSTDKIEKKFVEEVRYGYFYDIGSPAGAEGRSFVKRGWRDGTTYVLGHLVLPTHKEGDSYNAWLTTKGGSKRLLVGTPTYDTADGGAWNFTYATTADLFEYDTFVLTEVGAKAGAQNVLEGFGVGETN